MTQGTSSDGNRGIWRRPRVWFLFGIPLGGLLMFIAGIVAFGSFNLFMEYSNTLGFCISCHEMRDTVYEEYKKTIHYKNPAGVRAVCSDCHVPKPFFAKMERKIRASFNELPHKVMGTIDTPEKFKARRLKLAEEVWASMKATDSRECRNCHSLDTMDIAKQDRSAQKKHTLKRMQEKGETCIDCHKGIAHELPEGYEG